MSWQIFIKAVDQSKVTHRKCLLQEDIQKNIRKHQNDTDVVASDIIELQHLIEGIQRDCKEYGLNLK